VGGEAVAVPELGLWTPKVDGKAKSSQDKFFTSCEERRLAYGSIA
jgi:hypothetical protein